MGKLTIEELRAVRRRNNLTITTHQNKDAPEIRREDIAAQVELFITNGGKIQQINSDFRKPLKPNVAHGYSSYTNQIIDSDVN